VLVLVAYALLGYYSGVIRRVIGLITVYIAFLAATNLNTGIAQTLLNFQPFTAPADARMLSYVLVMAVVIVAVEGLATGYHERLQVAVVLLNRFTGMIVGLVSAVLLTGFFVVLLNGYAFPLGGTLTDKQVNVRTAVSSSVLGPVVVNLAKPIRPLFAVALPVEPQTFFTTSHG
jgi:hypothetical protein